MQGGLSGGTMASGTVWAAMVKTIPKESAPVLATVSALAERVPRAQVEAAARGYKDINLRALKLLGPGGILVTIAGRLAPDAGAAHGVRGVSTGRAMACGRDIAADGTCCKP